MKKIKIILIITLLLCPYIVKASTYDITGDSYYVENINENEELLDTERRYKFFKEKKIYSEEYFVQNSNPIEYPYISDNYIITDYSDFSKEYPEELPNRIIKSRDIYIYKKIKKIRYINLKDVKGSNGFLNIDEINIFNSNNKINYDINCVKCKNNANINDNNLYTNTLVTNEETLTIDLKDFYNPNDLKLEIYLSDNYGTDTTSFKIDTEEQNYLNINIETNMYTKNNNSYKLEFKLKDYIKNNIYDEEIKSEEEISNYEYNLIDKHKEYAYQDVKYLYYKIEKEYLNDFYLEKEGYIKDESNYKDYYKVRYKNKLKLKDNFIINSRNYDLYDMIEDTTLNINDIKIEDNIDITKNGLYKVTFKYNDFKVETYIMVDIEDMIESIEFTNNSDIQKASIISKEKIKEKEAVNIRKVPISLILISFLKFLRINLF